MDCDLEGEDAHVLVDVELSCPVEVEDGVERPGVSVKEVLVVNEAVVGNKVHNLLMGLHSRQEAQPGNKKILCYANSALNQNYLTALCL